ncbi:hypothetical protein RFI_28887, partial [Reticulomyxa filosa]
MSQMLTFKSSFVPQLHSKKKKKKSKQASTKPETNPMLFVSFVELKNCFVKNISRKRTMTINFPTERAPLFFPSSFSKKKKKNSFGTRPKNAIYIFCFVFKNQYRLICLYPGGVKLWGHCVVKRIKNNDQTGITLFSFGGFYNHTLTMKYESVWDGDEGEVKNKWMPLIDDNERPVRICDENNSNGVRAVAIDHLLFISHPSNLIDVFNLDTLTFITRDTLPINNSVRYHCFVSRTEYNCKSTTKKNELFLFYKNEGVIIGYDENDNTFQYKKVRVGKTLRTLDQYAYLIVDGSILFFGGYDGSTSNIVQRYSIKKNRWTVFKHKLPFAVYGNAGVWDEQMFVHIIGGRDKREHSSSSHFRIRVDRLLEDNEELWTAEDETKAILEDITVELEQNIGLRELQVEFI